MLFHLSVIFNCILIGAMSVTSTTIVNNKTANLLRESLEFYDSLKLVEYLNDFREFLSINCSSDLSVYIRALKDHKKWALQMDDSSGRYAGGWFWGNNFWMGSEHECRNIVSNNYEFNDRNQQENHRQEARKTRLSPNISKDYNNKNRFNSHRLPYPITFFTIKIKLNSTVVEASKRNVKLGLCLPFSCQNEDVKLLVQNISSKSNNAQVTVISVKSEHQYYNIFKDGIFWALCYTTGIIILFVILGTSIDLYHLKNQQRVGESIVYKTSNSPIKNNEENTLTCSSSIFKEILLAFSLRINMKIICDRTVGSDTISVIHGLKVISMIWVILGHTTIVMFHYSDNMEFKKIVQKEFIFQLIANAVYSVDTFFFASGLLVSFLYFRTCAKGKLDVFGNKPYLSSILHFLGLITYRFFRLSIPYLFVIGLTSLVMKWFRYNSIFDPACMDDINCPKYWWRNILYINVFYPKDDMCMMWSWYLSNDTQFYILGSILLVLATRYFKVAAFTSSFLIISSWLTTGYISLSYNYLPSSDSPLGIFDKIYSKPWTRVAPYLIGMSTGWLLFKINCKIKLSPWTFILCSLATATCLLLVYCSLHDRDLSAVTGAIYSSLSHSGWAISLAWIVIVCTTGYGGFLNKILSSPSLYPLSRVTYCVYLLHPLIIRSMVMYMENPFHLGKLLVITIFAGQVLTCYTFGFIMSIIYEAPVVSMLKILSKLSNVQPKTTSLAV